MEVQEMTLGELAAHVATHLRGHGIETVLTGGACVSLYSSGKYVSADLDFIDNLNTSRRELRRVLAEIGFREHDRYFEHADTSILLEFPPGPLSVGSEPIHETASRTFQTGQLRLLKPTDCVKDRLAAYYHWGDRQCLDQAVLVAQAQLVDIEEIERWSRVEGKLEMFWEIRNSLHRGRAPD